MSSGAGGITGVPEKDKAPEKKKRTPGKIEVGSKRGRAVKRGWFNRISRDPKKKKQTKASGSNRQR